MTASTDVRHDCGCRHSNDSHDPLIGCLYPGCNCANKSPAKLRAAVELAVLSQAVMPPQRRGRHRPAKRGAFASKAARLMARRLLRAILDSTAALVLAAAVLLASAMAAITYLMIREG